MEDEGKKEDKRKKVRKKREIEKKRKRLGVEKREKGGEKNRAEG